jgi:hypothetical protein
VCPSITSEPISRFLIQQGDCVVKGYLEAIYFNPVASIVTIESDNVDNEALISDITSKDGIFFFRPFL